jgi:lipid A ethanolaminephosphotransferase
MFSHLGRGGFDGRNQDYETLMDVLQHAGLAVLWIDNQSGCKGVCDRIPHVDTSALSHPRLCSGGQCQDEIMLEGLDQRIAALPPERVARGVVLLMHQMGSHGPAYHLRSPPAFKKFLPECTSVNLQDCSREELLNAYDNSIAYTDHFLGSTIDWLKQQKDFDTAMFFVGDHGESLGENNLYLHGMPFSIAPEVQKHVPWITWLSPGLEKRSGIANECLRGRRDLPLSHDNYFHTVLGLMQVSTAVYDRQLDANAPCAAQ